jgi:hypothetical protein
VAALLLKVGCNDRDVVTVTRSSVPLAIGRWIHVELCKHKQAVIKIIEAENEGGGT